MKGMKGKIIKKVKTIQAIGSLRHGLAFPLNSSVVDHKNKLANNDKCSICKDDDDLTQKNSSNSNNNNIGLLCNNKNNKPYFKALENEDDFDHHRQHEDDNDNDHDHDHDSEIMNSASLSDFEDKCPPGGSDKVILYTTSLRGIRKTFEDCAAVRFLLESFGVSFHERDVSLHREFKEELWEVLGAKVVPPRLFIKGRYIGGAEEVVGVLNEQGKLRKLFEGMPRVTSDVKCIGCTNVRFSICKNCCGSQKVLKDGESNESSCYVRCPECNENGLVKCDICC